MELTVGKKYRVTDDGGNCLIYIAIGSDLLELSGNRLLQCIGPVTWDRLRLDEEAVGLTVTPIDDKPAPQPTMDQARYAVLLEMLQAITAGIYYPEDRVGPEFDPNQAILHIRTRLAAFEKGNA